MSDFIKVYPNAVSDEICDYIVECLNKYKCSPGTVSGGKVKEEVKQTNDLNILEFSTACPSGYKQSKEYVYDRFLDKTVIPGIYSAVKKCLTQYNKSHPVSGVGPTGVWPENITDDEIWHHFYDRVAVDTVAILCKKYDKGKGYFNWHMDKGHRDCRSQNRAFITMFYCNDIEEGGETEWKYFDTKVKPKKGSVVVFPADWAWLHRGNMPVSDDKYICNVWWCFRSPHLAQEMGNDVAHWSIDDLYLP